MAHSGSVSSQNCEHAAITIAVPNLTEIASLRSHDAPFALGVSRYTLTNGQPPSLNGRNDWSAGMVSVTNW